MQKACYREQDQELGKGVPQTMGARIKKILPESFNRNSQNSPMSKLEAYLIIWYD